MKPNERDELALAAGAAALLPSFTMTGTAAEVRARVVDLAEAGVTEIAYQPAGPDIPRELATFAAGHVGARLTPLRRGARDPGGATRAGPGGR